MEEKFEHCGGGGVIYTANQDEIKRRLLVVGFDMKQMLYRGNDKEGNCIYAQKDHEAEDIKTAFEGEL